MTDAFDRIYGADAAVKRALVREPQRLEPDAYVILGDIFNGRTSWHYAPKPVRGEHDLPVDDTEELVPLEVVREVFDAWLDAGCPYDVRWVFSIGQGWRADIGTAIRALPRLQAEGYTVSELSIAWEEGRYMPLVWRLDGIDPEFADALGQA